MTGVTRETWAHSLLRMMALPETSENVKAIIAWETAEGGAGPQFGVPTNKASYNPLNTTQSPGKSVNSVGVKAYSTWTQGLIATSVTLRNGHYPGIISALKKGDSAQSVAAAVAASPWGTGDGVSKVLGSVNLTSSSPSGIAGLGQDAANTLGIGGAVDSVGGAISDAAKGVLSTAEAVPKLISALFDPHTYIRFAEVSGGLVIVLAGGVTLIFILVNKSTGGTTGKAVKAAVKVVR